MGVLKAARIAFILLRQTMQAFLDDMVAVDDGHLVWISSVAGHVAEVMGTSYRCVLKLFLATEKVLQCLQVRHTRHGVRA